MKKLLICMALATALLLVGCARTAPATNIPQKEDSAPKTQEGAVPAQNPTPAGSEISSSQALEEHRVLHMTLEGMQEDVPATRYVGKGYSIYIPDEGWWLEKDVDDGIPEDIWESTFNDDVELKVSHYEKLGAQEARKRFAADNDDYRFENLSGGTFGNPLVGKERDGDTLCFVSAESGDDTYIVSWQYPAGTEEGFGARLPQIADTFSVNP